VKNRNLMFLILLTAVFSFISSCAFFKIISGEDTSAEDAVLDTQNLPTEASSGYQAVTSTAAEEEIFAKEDTSAEDAVLDTQNLPTGDNSGYQPAASTAAEDEIVSWEDIDAAEAQKEIESANIQGASEEGFDKMVLEPTPAVVTAPKELEEEEESKK